MSADKVTRRPSKEAGSQGNHTKERIFIHRYTGLFRLLRSIYTLNVVLLGCVVSRPVIG